MLKIGLWGISLLHRTFSFSLRCYLYHLPDMWRKICHVEKFQISLRDKYGEIWYISTWGVFSNIAIWKMWINLKFLHIWHICVMRRMAPQLRGWRKNDKYQVPYTLYIYTTLQCYKVKYAATLQQMPKLSRFLKSAEWIRYIPIYLDLPSDCDIWPAD